MGNYVLIPFKIKSITQCVGISEKHLLSSGRKTLYYATGGDTRPDYVVVHCDIFDENTYGDELRKIIRTVIAAKITLIILVDVCHLQATLEIARSFGKSKLKEKKRDDTAPKDSELKKQIIGSASRSLSDNDILLRDEAISMLTAKDIMISDVITIEERVVVTRAWDKMSGNNHRELKIGHLPVISGTGTLQGIISESDLLPLLPPLGATSEEQEKLQDIMGSVRVEERMHKSPLHVGLDTDILEVVKVLCSHVDGHHISLLPVVQDETSLILLGVISWVEVLRRWREISGEGAITEKAGQLGTKFSDIIQFEPTDTIAFIVEELKRRKSNARHFLIVENGKPLKLVANRDILSYIPFGYENQHLLRLYFLTQIRDVKTTRELEEFVVSEDTAIGDETNPNSLIGKFVLSLAENQGWHNRIDGVLSVTVDGSGKVISLVTPFDCMKLLIASE